MSNVSCANDSSKTHQLPPVDDPNAHANARCDSASAGSVLGDQETDVNAARSLRDGLQHLDVPVSDTLSDTLDGLGIVARFSDNLFGETQYATSGTGRAAAAAVDTAASMMADRAFDNLLGSSGLGATTGSVLGVINSVDGFLDVNDAPKVLTSFASNLDPANLATHSADLLVDVGTVTANAFTNPDLARTQLQQVDADAVAGEYGAPIQGAAILGNLLADPTETANTVTSADAASGDYGVFVAWGNAAVDLMTDSGAANAPPQMVSMEEVERRQTFVGALF